MSNLIIILHAVLQQNRSSTKGFFILKANGTWISTGRTKWEPDLQKLWNKEDNKLGQHQSQTPIPSKSMFQVG